MPKKPKPRGHICRAVLPNGVTASRVTSQKYTHALCVPQITKTPGDLWVVLRWSKRARELQAEARRRTAHTHGERAAVVVPVEIVPW